MTSTTAAPPTTLPRRISVGWTASAFVLGGVVATAAAVATSSDDPTTSSGAAVVARPTALVVSADAAERWAMADGVAVEVASADAAERRAVAEQDRRQESCRGGSPDSVERCVDAS